MLHVIEQDSIKEEELSIEEVWKDKEGYHQIKAQDHLTSEQKESVSSLIDSVLKVPPVIRPQQA